jgi:hypothetical protein
MAELNQEDASRIVDSYEVNNGTLRVDSHVNYRGVDIVRSAEDPCVYSVGDVEVRRDVIDVRTF